MKRIATLMIALCLLAPLGARAQDDAPKKTKRAHKKSTHNETILGYGLAGCGLGSIAFGTKPGMIQIVAGTLNAIGANQLFGLSTGTSNCDIPEMGQKAAMFIEVNHETLAREAARGQGETVSGLAFILNCSDPATFGQSLQQNYERIFTGNKSTYDTTREILSTMKTDQALQASCETLS
jgi:hypothetical protein